MNWCLNTAFLTGLNRYQAPGRYVRGYLSLGKTWVVSNHTYRKENHILNLLNFSKISVIC